MYEQQLERLYYALAKQVPAMREEVTLHTRYGELTLYDRDAKRVAAVVERVLRKRQQRLQAIAEKAAQAAQA